MGGMPEDFDLDQLLERLREMLENMDIDLSELASAMLSIDANQLEQLIRQAAEQSGIETASRTCSRSASSAGACSSHGSRGRGGSLRDLMEQLRRAGHERGGARSSWAS